MQIHIPDKEATDYLYTLIVAQSNLPADAHPIHYERLRTIREQVDIQIKKQFREEVLKGAQMVD